MVYHYTNASGGTANSVVLEIICQVIRGQWRIYAWSRNSSREMKAVHSYCIVLSCNVNKCILSACLKDSLQETLLSNRNVTCPPSHLLISLALAFVVQYIHSLC